VGRTWRGRRLKINKCPDSGKLGFVSYEKAHEFLTMMYLEPGEARNEIYYHAACGRYHTTSQEYIRKRDK